MFDFKLDLNPSQYAAVTSKDGPMLVLAGAGSGKTRVIEYRALFLIQEGVKPESILLLTFTRKAAREMLSRSSSRDERCQRINGGTFHSFAYKTLKRNSKFFGFPESFSVLDESDAEEAVRRCADSLGLIEKGKRFPKKETLKSIISSSINKGVSIAEVLKKQYPYFIQYNEDVEEIRKKYAEYKIDKNYLDYDDLLTYLRILLEDEDMRKKISREYEYIMVDEYQDTNPLQGDITYLLAKDHRNVVVVGDDAQSIYSFRGASHDNIMIFPERFKECKKVALEENYRSTQSILDVANAVLENMENKYSKVLISANKEIGRSPKLQYFKNQYEEADWIARKIRDLRDGGVNLGNQGVLFRSAFISISLQIQLDKMRIPYQVVGGRKFYEMAHVKDFLSHLKVLSNRRDELAWSRMLMMLPGVGPKTAENILVNVFQISSFDEIIDHLSSQYRGNKYEKQLERLSFILKKASKDELKVFEQLETIMEYYLVLLKDNYDDWNIRLNDLEVIKEISNRYSSLDTFLADFAIDRPEKGIFDTASSFEDQEPVTLTTIHSAKGLEWDVVFIMNVAEGVLPISFALNSPEEVAEEQRLFYVALTRARKELYLSFPFEAKRGGNESYYNELSRFIKPLNVSSKIDSNNYKQENESVITVDDGIEPNYNKKSILDRILDSYRK